METTDDEHGDIGPKQEINIKISDFLNYQQYEDIPSAHSLYPLKTLPFKISNAYLLSVPILKEPFDDLYPKIIYEKHYFNQRVDKVRVSYVRARRKNHHNIDVLDCYKKMQDLFDRDPDRYFNSSYNWYYSGGTLDIAEIGDSHLVMQATENTKLCLTKIVNKKAQWYKIDQNSIPFPSNPIYEISSLTNNNDLLIGVRSKNDFNLLKLNDDLSCGFVKENHSPIPYVSFALSPKNANEYALLNADQKLEVWNVNKNRMKVYNVTDPNVRTALGENWGKVKYLSNNLIFYCNNISVTKTDLRTRQNFDTKTTSELSLSGEKITNICFKDENNFYLTTEKHAVEIDGRKNKAVRKWTHLLKEKIFLSDSCQFENDDLLFLSSENPQERVILGSDEHNIKLPISVPALSKSLDNFLINTSLNVEFCIRDRLSTSTTGLKLIQNKNTVSIFTLNSIGDLYINEMFIDKFNLDKIKDRCNAEFKNFDDILFSNIEKTNPLYFNDKVIIKNLKEVLKREKKIENPNVSRSKLLKLNSLKEKLKRKADRFKTFLNSAWEVEHPINAIDEIESNVNVQMWLSKIEENVENGDIEKDETEEFEGMSQLV